MLRTQEEKDLSGEIKDQICYCTRSKQMHKTDKVTENAPFVENTSFWRNKKEGEITFQ